MSLDDELIRLGHWYEEEEGQVTIKTRKRTIEMSDDELVVLGNALDFYLDSHTNEIDERASLAYMLAPDTPMANKWAGVFHRRNRETQGVNSISDDRKAKSSGLHLSNQKEAGMPAKSKLDDLKEALSSRPGYAIKDLMSIDAACRHSGRSFQVTGLEINGQPCSPEEAAELAEWYRANKRGDE